ncbi:hypothetical protein chiPu_0007464 [Chiloscyllium punctatum]|uniref:Uncharacterized protein n=1 Tax=Chiloscyllium punctatum TaxID=137246 RepID=A0A401SF63_CHIPU|nr:hypothetical protein [Chiloscyllium punctatum]
MKLVQTKWTAISRHSVHCFSHQDHSSGQKTKLQRGTIGAFKRRRGGARLPVLEGISVGRVAEGAALLLRVNNVTDVCCRVLCGVSAVGVRCTGGVACGHFRSFSQKLWNVKKLNKKRT